MTTGKIKPEVRKAAEVIHAQRCLCGESYCAGFSVDDYLLATHLYEAGLLVELPCPRCQEGRKGDQGCSVCDGTGEHRPTVTITHPEDEKPEPECTCDRMNWPCDIHDTDWPEDEKEN
jgi:hypothetical protein